MSDFDKFNNMEFEIYPKHIKIGTKKENSLYQSNKGVVIGSCYIDKFRDSYVVLDKKGISLHDTNNIFIKKGYNIYVLDTIDMKNSMHFNPFAYIKNERDIPFIADMLLKCFDYKETPVCPFFSQTAILWLITMIGYLHYEIPLKDKNVPKLVEFLDMEISRKDSVDRIFEELEQKNPKHYAVKQRRKYKCAMRDSAVNDIILRSLYEYLSDFNNPKVADLVSYDELHFDTYGDARQKSILYVIISDTDTTYNFIVRLLFSQMFRVLVNKADKRLNGRLATPVQFILDDVALLCKNNDQ